MLALMAHSRKPAGIRLILFGSIVTISTPGQLVIPAGFLDPGRLALSPVWPQDLEAGGTWLGVTSPGAGLRAPDKHSRSKPRQGPAVTRCSGTGLPARRIKGPAKLPATYKPGEESQFADST